MNPYEINLHEYICMNNGAQQNLSQIRNKPKRLTSRDKMEPVNLSLKSFLVESRSQSKVDLSQKSISVES